MYAYNISGGVANISYYATFESINGKMVIIIIK
jgi:hypothetical protein